MFALACAIGLPAASSAQQSGKAKPQSKPEEPCCGVVGVDSLTAIVTARETASGYTFKFRVSDKKLLTSLKIGEKVWADFTKKTVRLRKADAAPCCIITTAEPGDADPMADQHATATSWSIKPQSKGFE
jgi:hypothetical protein